MSAETVPAPGELLGAVDVGGTRPRTALVSPEGPLQGKTRVRVRPTEEISQVADAVRALVAGRPVRRVIIGMPGRIDRRTGLPATRARQQKVRNRG